jgi:hypothetical protein
MTDPNIFDHNTDTTADSDNPEVYTAYVKEKYGDVDADPVVAKAVYHKDKFIEQLQRENAGVRQEMQTRIRMEEFLDKMNSRQSQDYSNDQDPPERENVPTEKPLTAEDVKRLLAEQQKVDRQMRNTQEVIDTLKQKLGPDYSTKVKQILSQIGMDETRANTLAADSPAAFYRMLGIDQPQKENFMSPPRGNVNTGALGTTSNRGPKYSDFQRMMKEKPEEYWQPRVQNEILRLAELHGDDWLNT